VPFCGLFPKMARLTNRLSIVRSFTHRDSAHEGAQHWVKTGYPYPEEFINKAQRLADQNPAFGAIVARQRGPIHASGVAPYVRIFHTTMSYHDGPAGLGNAYAPFKIGDGVNTMLNDMTLKIAPERLADRRGLLASLDRLNRELDQTSAMQGMDTFQQQAMDVV